MFCCFLYYWHHRSCRSIQLLFAFHTNSKIDLFVHDISKFLPVGFLLKIILRCVFTIVELIVRVTETWSKDRSTALDTLVQFAKSLSLWLWRSHYNLVVCWCRSASALGCRSICTRNLYSSWLGRVLCLLSPSNYYVSRSSSRRLTTLYPVNQRYSLSQRRLFCALGGGGLTATMFA